MEQTQTGNGYLQPNPPKQAEPEYASDTSLSIPSLVVDKRVSSYFQSRNLPQGFPTGDSALDFDLNDPSLLMALSEPMFTTSTAVTPSIQTPSDSRINIDPIVVTVDEMADGLPPVLDVGDEDVTDAEQPVVTPKKRNTLIRVVKKAGASAKKLAHRTRSLTNRREQKPPREDVQTVFEPIQAPQDPFSEPVIELPNITSEQELNEDEEDEEEIIEAPAIPVASFDSLAATLGSPTTLSSFPLSPPSKVVGRFKPPKDWDQKQNSSSITLQTSLKVLLQAILLVPYALLVGFLPFLAPTSLSAVTFSPLLGLVSPPTSALERYQYHMKVLPCHIGLASGFMGVLNWELLSNSTLLFVALNALFLVTTWWTWRDFDFVAAISDVPSDAELGEDDRAIIFDIFKATVPRSVHHILCGMASILASQQNQRSANLEAWTGDLGKVQLDVTLPLNEPSLEPVRIIVQLDD